MFWRVWFALHTDTILAVSCPGRGTRSRHQAGPDWTLHREASEWGGHRRSVATSFRKWIEMIKKGDDAGILDSFLQTQSQTVHLSRSEHHVCGQSERGVAAEEALRQMVQREVDGSRQQVRKTPAAEGVLRPQQQGGRQRNQWTLTPHNTVEAPAAVVFLHIVGADLSGRVSCRSTRLRCRSCQPRLTLPAPTGVRSLPRTSSTAVTSPWPFTVRARVAAAVSASRL